MLAEKIANLLGIDQVPSELRFARTQPKCTRFDHSGLKPDLAAYRAVPSEYSRAQVDVRFKPHRAA
jgi:hypothetical protein